MPMVGGKFYADELLKIAQLQFVRVQWVHFMAEERYAVKYNGQRIGWVWTDGSEESPLWAAEDEGSGAGGFLSRAHAALSLIPRGAPIKHGQPSTYSKWGCRCPKCTTARERGNRRNKKAEQAKAKQS